MLASIECELEGTVRKGRGWAVWIGNTQECKVELKEAHQAANKEMSMDEDGLRGN